MRSFVRTSRLGALVAVLSVGLFGVPAQADNGPVHKKCQQLDIEKCERKIEKDVTSALEGLEGEETYPNLVPNVTYVEVVRPFGWDPITMTFFEEPPQLWFDTHSQNLGVVPMDLINDEPENVTNPAVAQCVAWTTDFVCRERRRVGGFVLHVPHNHFHFDDFAAYELRALLGDGSVDYSAGGLLSSNEKVSFCLVDSEAVAPNARPTPAYVACTSVREGISPGWADIYTSDLEGQQLEIGGLDDGRYALVVDMDVSNHLYESDDTDNRLEVIVELSNGLEDVAIVERRWS